MPEQPFPKTRTPVAVTPKQCNSSGYAELHCRTNYSFLEGASHPDELVARACELNLTALAITDRHSVAGVVRAYAAAKPAYLKLLIGSEIVPVGHSTAVVLATDRSAYGRLCRLLTDGRRRAPKGECLLEFEHVAERSEGLLACVVLDPGRTEIQRTELLKWKSVFGDRLYAITERDLGPRDHVLLRRAQELAKDNGIPLVAANDVHYHVAARRRLHDVLTAIRHGLTVAEIGEYRFSNGERHLKSAEQMRKRFASAPDIVARTVEVAGRCNFSLDELKYEYPEELCPRGEHPLGYLKRMTGIGAAKRYPQGVPEKVQRLIDHEMRLIEELR